MRRRRVISIIGGADCTDQECKIAEEVGQLLAEAGVVVVCGGRGGVMEAVCRGARDAGGTTVGILPGHDHDSGNPYLEIVLPTGLGHHRNLLVAQAGEAVIAIGGGEGTLSEIGIALKTGRKVVGIGTWKVLDKSGKPIKILEASNASEAVGLALEARNPHT